MRQAETWLLRRRERLPNEDAEMVDNSEILVLLQDGARAIIERKLEAEEKILAFASATIPPPGAAATWLPFVGKIVELGRQVATKAYLLVVTNSRFWMLGINKWSRKNVEETSFEAFPIADIKTVVTDKKGIYDAWHDDSLKLSTFSGRNLEFRGIEKANADLIRNAIIQAQEASQA